MTDAHDRVKAEMARFLEALPKLRETLEGRWVVFLDGAVRSDHDTQERAYVSAVDVFGLQGGFVVAQVVEVKPVHVRW